MAYEFQLKRQLLLRTTLTPCAHLCRYCCISSKGDHALVPISIERFLALAERFTQWGKTADYSIVPIMHNSDEITAEMVPLLDGSSAQPSGSTQAEPDPLKLRKQWLRTGGLRMRSDAEIQRWIEQWRKTGGAVVHGSFAGYRETHDWWNNREGDYDFLMRIQKVAVELGIEVGQTFFLMKNTLPDLRAVLDDIERLNARHRHRFLIPVGYLGRARSNAAQRERVTEEDLDQFARLDIASETGFERERWKSEREWITAFRSNGHTLQEQGLCLRVNEQNVGKIESTPCDEIVDELLRRTTAAYAALPSHRQLMDAYGDSNSTRIYAWDHEVERLWLDRHIRRHDPQFERGLTHLL